jgi:hypothetical protein
MHGHHHHRQGRRGFRPQVGHRFYSSDNVLERLETYQRDLEQELADVADLIRRLHDGAAKSGTPDQTATV